ncbi:hypothetical protein OHS59_04740 [Streptomyces sp. NBC_00414]|uniref:hypothetical protein n=1 Tax=Streptomyces sp. NBC_00414 TaxID=2975739 RepID=UPI002E1E80DB
MNPRTVARPTFANPTSAVYLTVVGGSIVVASGLFQSFALGLLHESVRTRLRGRFHPHRA